MKKRNFDTLLVIRYIIYFSVAGSILALENPSANVIPKLLTFLLLYIINAQIRINYLKRYTYAIIVSLFFEITIISLLYYNFGGFTFIYYFIAILDAVLMLPKTHSYILTFILYAAVIFQSSTPFYNNLQNYPVINIIFNTLIVMGFGGLGRYIQEEKSRKIKAQMLYDQISISEQELKEAYTRLENYSSTIEELTILRERNRISREIHDTVGHTLSTLIIQIQALPYVIKNDTQEANAMLQEMLSYTKTGLEDVRRAVKELNPSDFDNHNGVFVLQELVHKFQSSSGINVRFSISKTDYELTTDQSFILYRVLQEALNNALRHGKATLVEINLHFSEKEIYLHIIDNGSGSDKFTLGFGLSGIKQRVESIGGRVSYTSEVGQGFELNIILPKNSGYLKKN